MNQDASATPPLHDPPPGFTASRDGHRLHIDLKWGSWRRWRFVALAGAGIGGVSVVATLFLHRAHWIDAQAATVVNASVLGLILVMTTLLVTSRTSVRVGDGWIRVRHRRYLFPVVRSYGTDGLAQLFTIRVRGHDAAETFYRFHLVALGKDGRKSILVPGLRLREQARFLERVVESHLGIADRPVHGELRRVAPRFKPSPPGATKRWPSWQFGLIMRQFISQPRLSRRGQFVRDIRFMLTGKEFKARHWGGKPRQKNRE